MPADLTYQNAVEALLGAVPEFREAASEWDEDLPYDVFGSFALYICDLVRRSHRNADQVSRSLRFLERMAHSTDEEVVTLLVVGVLEVVADDPMCKAAVIADLDEDMAALFEQVDAFWRPSA